MGSPIRAKSLPNRITAGELRRQQARVQFRKNVAIEDAKTRGIAITAYKNTVWLVLRYKRLFWAFVVFHLVDVLLMGVIGHVAGWWET